MNVVKDEGNLENVSIFYRGLATYTDTRNDVHSTETFNFIALICSSPFVEPSKSIFIAILMKKLQQYNTF